jgi:hypothetical protein
MHGKEVYDTVLKGSALENHLEPGAIMSLAFATETEGMRLGMAVVNGVVSLSELEELIENTDDAEPMLALGWIIRWANESVRVEATEVLKDA